MPVPYVWLLCGYNNNSHTYRRIPAYTDIYQMRCTAYKVAPDDGLIQSETCRASNEKIKSNHKNFVHFVRLCTYCKMMHGACNIAYSLCQKHRTEVNYHGSNVRRSVSVSNQSRWPYGVRRRSASAWLLRLRFRMFLRASKFVCCACSGLCEGLIARSKESYRVCLCLFLSVCLIVCDPETSTSRWPRPD